MWGALVVAATVVATAIAPSTTPVGSDDAPNTKRKKRSEWVYTFPVGGPDPYYPRDHLHYPAADITNCRRLVRAPISGVISDVRRVDKWNKKVDDPGTRGGLTITLHGDDFVRYYFSHLGRLMAKKGQRVESGQKIGTVGDSGNAKVTLCHLHFGISRICPMSEQNILRGEIWPQPYLDAWKKGVNKSPHREVQQKTRKEPAACLEAAAAQRRVGD